MITMKTILLAAVLALAVTTANAGCLDIDGKIYASPRCPRNCGANGVRGMSGVVMGNSAAITSATAMAANAGPQY